MRLTRLSKYVHYNEITGLKIKHYWMNVQWGQYDKYILPLIVIPQQRCAGNCFDLIEFITHNC